MREKAFDNIPLWYLQYPSIYKTADKFKIFYQDQSYAGGGGSFKPIPDEDLGKVHVPEEIWAYAERTGDSLALARHQARSYATENECDVAISKVGEAWLQEVALLDGKLYWEPARAIEAWDAHEILVVGDGDTRIEIMRQYVPLAKEDVEAIIAALNFFANSEEVLEQAQINLEELTVKIAKGIFVRGGDANE